MARFLTIIRQKLNILSCCAFCISFLIFTSACTNSDYSSSNTGSISFSVEWRSAPTIKGVAGPTVTRALDCGAAGVTLVEAEIYDENDSYLTSGGPWLCSAHAGTIENVPEGTNRKVVVLGSDYNNNVIYRGEKTGITVIAGQTTNAGIIIVQPHYLSMLPDTGQVQSYTDTFGEDSDYTINPPSYTDNADGTITDNVTGLIWQKEDDDTQHIWDDAVSYCNDLSIAGSSDWRLPSEKELMSIVNCDTYNPSINTTYFPGTNASPYWSSTVNVYLNTIWHVFFSNGSVNSMTTDSHNYVRCVRGQELSFGNFNDNGDGTVTDNNTGLMWQQSEGGQQTWEGAITYCEDLSLYDYTDWRLPNKNELNSIVDYEIYDPAIDTNFFPGVFASSPDGGALYYWSSTTLASDSSYAWNISFYTGMVASGYLKSNSGCYVRCVRAGR